jgi:ribosomal 30S subunit maturation factor RimM
MNESKNTSINLWVDPEDAPELSEDFFYWGKK